MMTDKLDAERLYYVKKKNGDVCTRQSHLFSTLKTEKAVPFVDFDDNDIEEVLAPVPNYQEARELKAQLAEYKELPRECQPYIKSEKENWIQQGYWDTGKQILKISNLLTKIKEVLR